ncbi:MAG: hypothetical protein JST09_14135 [Bacteroidetes bacterium]|nr:hypothetical protein [Pseudomonadota bacterium]MBS1576440.1 hypothetical protein [Bacteroidota bacterium]
MEYNFQVIEILKQQLDQRFEKLWRIFHWCGGLLISITGAVLIAAKAKEKSMLSFPFDHLLISYIILVIIIYSWNWIDENLKFEMVIRNQLEKLIQENINYKEILLLRPDKKTFFGYKNAILFLGIAAICATWMDQVVKLF